MAVATAPPGMSAGGMSATTLIPYNQRTETVWRGKRGQGAAGARWSIAASRCSWRRRCKQGHRCRRSSVELVVKSVMKMALRSLLASDQSVLLRRKETPLVPIIQTHGDVSKMEENLVLLKYLWRNCNLKRDLINQ